MSPHVYHRRWHLTAGTGIGCLILVVSLAASVSAAELRGRVDTTHAYASNLFPASNAEVTLVSLETKKVAGHTFTSTDGQYFFRDLILGDHLLLLRTGPEQTYWTNRIYLKSESVTITPLFLSDLGLGYASDPKGWSVRPFGDPVALRHIKCVDYEVTTTDGEKKTICESPFVYASTQTGFHQLWAGIRFTNGAYRATTRAIRYPPQLTATGRNITVGPCPTVLKLISAAEQEEGIALEARTSSATSAGGRVESFQSDRERAVVYSPPESNSELIIDEFDFVIRRDAQRATGHATLRLFQSLAVGCPQRTKK